MPAVRRALALLQGAVAEGWVTGADVKALKAALEATRQQRRTTVIVIETDPEKRVPGYESWWDVAVAEVSESPSVRAARKKYEKAKTRERYFL